MYAVRMTSWSSRAGRSSAAGDGRRPPLRPGIGVQRLGERGERVVPLLPELHGVLDLLESHDGGVERVEGGHDLRLLPPEVHVVSGAAGAVRRALVVRDLLAVPVGEVGAAAARGDEVLARGVEVVEDVERRDRDVATHRLRSGVLGPRVAEQDQGGLVPIIWLVGWNRQSPNA